MRHQNKMAATIDMKTFYCSAVMLNEKSNKSVCLLRINKWEEFVLVRMITDRGSKKQKDKSNLPYSCYSIIQIFFKLLKMYKKFLVSGHMP